MFAKIKAWIVFIWNARKAIESLKAKNLRQQAANGILFGKMVAKESVIDQLKAKHKFEIEASMETKVRVWIKQNTPLSQLNKAMTGRMIVLLNSSLPKAEVKKHKGPIQPLHSKEEIVKHKGLSKGFRR